MTNNNNHIISLIITKTNSMDILKNLAYQLPTLNLLTDYVKSYSPSKDETEDMSNRIKGIFESFGVLLEDGDVSVGSNVTQYEFVPSKGTKLSKIRGLENDIALHLGVLGVRIIAPVKGKGVVAVEVPNSESNIVGLKTVLSVDYVRCMKMELPISLGETATGTPFTFDLTKLPHILIGGATGMGKSVAVNVLLASLMINCDPSILKFVMVDVKKVELSMYEELEGLFKPRFINKMIYTETDEVVETLNKVVGEMDSRYDLLKSAKCRTIKEYNSKIVNGELSFNEGHEFLPYIVIVIDEFADLIMTVGKAIEFPITRLAQLARAIGIHLIVATQRPTTTVITGSIKANFPVRIAYRVASNIDSRTILDCGGAENLIGKGDALVSNGINLDRIQTAWIDSDEIAKLIKSIVTNNK
jgi:S-DNA-T family DNA segregation ATPase FtsK/SpoIIIE